MAIGCYTYFNIAFRDLGKIDIIQLNFLLPFYAFHLVNFVEISHSNVLILRLK